MSADIQESTSSSIFDVKYDTATLLHYLQSFYEKHYPKSLSKVPNLCNKYIMTGKIRILENKLINKYGVGFLPRKNAAPAFPRKNAAPVSVSAPKDRGISLSSTKNGKERGADKEQPTSVASTKESSKFSRHIKFSSPTEYGKERNIKKEQQTSIAKPKEPSDFQKDFKILSDQRMRRAILFMVHNPTRSYSEALIAGGFKETEANTLRYRDILVRGIQSEMMKRKNMGGTAQQVEGNANEGSMADAEEGSMTQIPEVTTFEQEEKMRTQDQNGITKVTMEAIPQHAPTPAHIVIDLSSDEGSSLNLFPPTSCPTCTVPLQSLYALHSHPLLHLPSCSLCASAAGAVEQALGDDTTACSWCGIDIEDEDEVLLFLCDHCPRGFCESCVALGVGENWKDVVASLKIDSGPWKCLLCDPTEGIMIGRAAMKKKMEAVEEKNGGLESKEEETAAERAVETLSKLEIEIEETEECLSDMHLQALRQQLVEELDKESVSGEPAMEKIEHEISSYVQLWSRHYERLVEQIPSAQEDLEKCGVSLLAFYEENKCGKAELKEEQARQAAEEELNGRDRSRGRVTGADGYVHPDVSIYNLELEDVPSTAIEEIHTSSTLSSFLKDRNCKAGILTGFESIQHVQGEELLRKMDRAEQVENMERIVDAQIVLEKEDAANELQDIDRIGKNRRHRVTTEVEEDIQRIHLNKREKEMVSNSRLTTVSCRSYNSDRRSKRRIVPTPLNDQNRLTSLSSNSRSSSLFPCRLNDIYGTGKSPAPTVSYKYIASSCILNPEDMSDTPVSLCRQHADILKPHQVDGVKFMWRNVCGSVRDVASSYSSQRSKDDRVQGCLLAHMMGLGKSIQTIAFIYAMLTHPFLSFSKWEGVDRKFLLETKEGCMIGDSKQQFIKNVLLIVPVNVLSNWEDEFVKWVNSRKDMVKIALHFVKSNPEDRITSIRQWKREGGVLLCTLDTFSRLLNKETVFSEQNQMEVRESLLTPDLVVVDEAHQGLKNDNSARSKALFNIKCGRRIGLTGTPLQNNLNELYNIVSWVRSKPHPFGGEADFKNKYVNVILNGSRKDSSDQEVLDQQTRVAELYRTIEPFVQRCTSEILAKDLPFMQEAVITIRQSKMQKRLYNAYTKYQKRRGNNNFFESYQKIQLVCNHPGVLIYQRRKLDRSSKTKEISAAQENLKEDKNIWWTSVAESRSLDKIKNGGKMVVLLELIARADLARDKVVVFSESLPTLDLIEYYLSLEKWYQIFLDTNLEPHIKTSWSSWSRNIDYERIDGSMKSEERGDVVTSFNAASNRHYELKKVILISKNAGGVGINLTGANRVIMIDSHWNPAIDAQAMFRCYRYGQTKPVFVYRLLAEGTMEEKIFARQVNKMALSARVLDQQSPDRTHTEQELNDLLVVDNWACCDKCDKWRMIPPWVDAESTIKLEDNWYCSLNEHDPKHSYCSAPERDKVWYNKHFQQMQKMRENGSTLCQEEDLDCNEMKVADKSEEEEKKYILEAKLLLRDSLLCDMNENGTAGKKWFARINVNSDNLDGITDINEVYSTSNNSAMSAVNSDSTNKIESQFVSPKKVLATQDFFVKAQGLAKKLEGPVCKKKENKLPKDLIHRDMLLDQSKTTSIIQKNKVHESGTETTCDSKSKISTSVSTNHQKMKTPSSGSSKMEKTQKNNASLSTICKMIYKKGGNCYQSLSQDDVVNLLSSEDESVTESDNSKDSSPKPNEAKNFQVKPFCGNTEKVINKSEISSDKYVISRESPEKKNRKSQIEENMNLEQPLREGFGTSLKKSDLARKVLKKRKKSRQEEDPRLTDPSKISDKLENHVISFSNKQEEDLRLKNPLKISKTKNNHMSSSSESKDIFVPEESQMSRRKQNITMDTSQQPKTPKKPEVSKESQMSRRKQNIAMETSQPPKTPTKPEVEELVTLVRSSGRKIKMSSKFTSSNITLSQSSKRTRGHSVPKSSPKSKEKRSKKDCAGFRSIQLLSSLSSGSDDDSEMKCPVSKSKRKFSKKSSQTSAGSDNDSLGMSSSILREKKMSKHFLSDRSPKKKASQLTNESNSQKSDVEHVSKFPKRAKKFSKTLSETSLESENNHELKNSLKDREKFLVKTIITEKSIKQRLSQSPKANETDFSKSDDSFSKSRSAKRIRQLSKRSSKTSLRSGNDSLVKNSLRHKETVSMKKISSEKCMRQRSSQSSKSCETDSLGVNSLSGKRKLPWDTRSSERFQISPKHKKKTGSILKQILSKSKKRNSKIISQTSVDSKSYSLLKVSSKNKRRVSLVESSPEKPTRQRLPQISNGNSSGTKRKMGMERSNPECNQPFVKNYREKNSERKEKNNVMKTVKKSSKILKKTVSRKGDTSKKGLSTPESSNLGGISLNTRKSPRLQLRTTQNIYLEKKRKLNENGNSKWQEKRNCFTI